MHESSQVGGSSHRVLNKSSSPPQIEDEMSQIKAKRREKPDQVQDASKQEKSMEIEDSDSGHFIQDEALKIEDTSNIAHRDGGLTSIDGVDKILQVMIAERSDSSINSPDVLSHRILLVNIIASTDDEECLKYFLEVGGLPIIDKWLQDAHKGKIGESEGMEDGDKRIEDLMLVLLKALEKLPVGLDDLRECLVGKSVNNLRSHKNSEVQKKARKLVDTWKKRVGAEIRSSGDLKHSSIALSAKQLPTDTVIVKCCSSPEVGAGRSTSTEKVTSNSSPSLANLNISKENSSIASEALPSTLNDNISCQSPNSQALVSKENSLPTEDFRSSTTTSTDSRSTTTVVKDSAGVKHNSINKISSSEKSTDRDISDGTKAESLMCHRIIVRIPNPGRNYLPQLAVTDTLSRGSSPGSTNKQDSSDVKAKILEVQSTSGEVKNVNGNSRSPGDSVEEQESGECESLDAEHSPGFSLKISGNNTKTNECMDIVASVACCEDSEADNRVFCKQDCASENCNEPVKDDAKIFDEPIDDTNANVGASSDGEADTSNLAHVQEDRVNNKGNPVLEKILTDQIEDSYEDSVLAKTKKDEKDEHDEEIVELSDRGAVTDSPKSPVITSPVQNSKDDDLLSGYFEEDALEVARQVAIEVEQEVEEDEEYSKPDSEDPDRIEQLHESPSPQTTGSGITKDLGRTNDDAEEKITKMNDIAEENRDVDQTSSCCDKVDEQCGTVPAENEMNIKETEDTGSNEVIMTGNNSSSVITECQVDEPTTDEAPLVSGGGSKGDSTHVRPVFDLNEGFLDDDSCNDVVTSACNAHIVPETLTCPAVTSVIATPIAVVAASKGGFIPPTNPLKSKLDLGWKGSAATSAFRPAEPRHSSGVSKQVSAIDIPRQPRNLEIDLNVANEIVTEESSLVCSSDIVASITCNQVLKTASINESKVAHAGIRHLTTSGPELDLNRVDEGEDNSCPASSASRTMLDFDLNDGPGVDETMRMEPPKISHGIVVYGDSYTNCRVMSSDVGNNGHWGTFMNPVQSTMIPFSTTVSESSRPIPVTPAASSIENNMPVSYSGFQFASPPSYLTSSISYAASITSPPVPAHMAAVGSPYIMPYVTSAVEVPKPDTNSRRNLDLNAGPDLVDIDSRMWQVPAFGQLSFQQSAPSSGFIKRKEPDGGFDQYRSGLKQMNWP